MVLDSRCIKPFLSDKNYVHRLKRKITWRILMPDSYGILHSGTGKVRVPGSAERGCRACFHRHGYLSDHLTNRETSEKGRFWDINGDV